MDSTYLLNILQNASYGTIVTTSCFFLLFLYFLKRSVLGIRRGRLPPGPRGVPFFGNFLQIDLKFIHVKLREWGKEFGGIMTINILGENIVVLQSAEMIDKALLDPAYADHFTSRAPSFSGDYIVQKGTIFHNLSKRCTFARKVMIRCMKNLTGKYKNYDMLMNENQDELLETFRNFDGEPFNPKDVGQRFSIRSALTSWTGSRSPPEDEILSLIGNVGASLSYFSNQGKSFLLKSIPPIRWIPTKDGYRYREILRNTRIVSDSLLNNAKTYPLSDDMMLHSFIRQAQSEENRATDIGFSMKALRDTITDLSGAGVETPSSLFYSTLYAAARRQDLQKRIQTEIANGIGSSRPPSLSDRHLLPYTEATVMEVLRMAPPLRLSVPYAVTSDVEFDGYFLPKNTQIFVNLWEPQHDEKFWHRPHKFDPTRFLDDQGRLHPPSHDVNKRMYAFGVGKRACPGKAFTLARIPILVAAVLQRYDIVLAEDATQELEDTFRSPNDCIVFNVPPYKIRAIER